METVNFFELAILRVRKQRRFVALIVSMILMLVNFAPYVEATPEVTTNADYGHLFTEEEKILMANVVYEEARGESYDGKVLIAAIILNRYFEGSDVDFTRESIYSVVTQPWQMAYKSSEEYNIKEIFYCKKAVDEACANYDGYIVVSEEEKFLLTQVVYEQAQWSNYDIKVSVADNILYNTYFEGDSIYDVIMQQGKMPDLDSEKIQLVTVIIDCINAVEAACAGEDPSQGETFPKGALFWFNPEKVNGYQALIRTGIDTVPVGNHLAHNEFNWGPY